MQIDSRHKIGFSQFFQDTQASLPPPSQMSLEHNIDPNHKIGFSQLFAGTQSQASRIPDEGPSLSEPKVDSRHKVGFSQLFEESQKLGVELLAAQNAPVGRGLQSLVKQT
jgi:hypothetical protein